MYGMVNQALENMVCGAHGEDVWEQIKARAGVDVDLYLSNKTYPDEMTYQLVGAASEILATPAQELLVAFGIHWVVETAAKSYGPMMQAAGGNLRDFLLYLPNFHTRVNLMFPQLQPPRFVCTDVGQNSLLLHYHSDRRGLAPFVTGLIQGLGQYFQTPVEIRQETEWSEASGHDSFSVRWAA